MKQNFVTFFSPGTFVAEQTELKIDTWDVDKAIEMSKNIKERYGAVPYGFQFTTRERSDDELDSHEVDRSNMYFLGGDVFTVDDLELIGNPEDRILIQNMKANDWYKVVINTNSYKWTQPLKSSDVVLKV